MAGFTYATLTNAGDQAINEAISNAWPLAIVKNTCGSGFPASGDVPPQFTGLKTYVMDMQTTSVNASVLYQTTVRVRVNTSAAPSVFVLNEIGVWASLNNGTPFLFAYMTTGNATGGDTIDPGTTIIRDYVVPIVYSQSYPANPVIEITPQVDLHASTHLSSGVDPIPIASSTIGGLTPKTNTRGAQVLTGPATATWGPVPISSATDAGGLPPSPNDPTKVGVGTNPATWAGVPIVTHANQGGLPITPLKANYRPLTAPDGSVSWQPTTPTLNVSTTLWVKTGFPDIAPNFSTLQNALAYLGQYVFAPGISALINVYPGHYASASAINIDHVNGQQITIQGINASGNLDGDVSYTGLGAISGSSGNWTAQLTGCSSLAQVTVGGYISAWSAGSVASGGNALLCGFFKVLAISGTTVTIQIPFNGSTWPSMAGFTNGAFTPINAIFWTTSATQTGIGIGTHGLASLRNIGIVQAGPNANGYVYGGISTLGPTTFNRCGVSGFQNDQPNVFGFYIVSAPCSLFNCAASACSSGIVVGLYGLVTCYNCAFTHNTILGINVWGGSIGAAHGVTFVAANSYSGITNTSIYIANKGQFIISGDPNGGNYLAGVWWNVWNGYNGVTLTVQSVESQSDFRNQVYSINNLGSYDLVLSQQSTASSGAFAGTRRFNIPIGTLTTDGCYLA